MKTQVQRQKGRKGTYLTDTRVDFGRRDGYVIQCRENGGLPITKSLRGERERRSKRGREDRQRAVVYSFDIKKNRDVSRGL